MASRPVFCFIYIVEYILNETIHFFCPSHYSFHVMLIHSLQTPAEGQCRNMGCMARSILHPLLRGVATLGVRNGRDIVESLGLVNFLLALLNTGSEECVQFGGPLYTYIREIDMYSRL